MNIYATSIDQTPVLATVAGYDHGIREIAVLADARMQIVSDKGTFHNIKLSKAAFDRIAGSISVLANVELDEVHRKIVCKMVLIPSLSDLSISFFDFETGTYAKNLTLILTGQSCALAHEVFPKNQSQNIDARELREQLVILALNSLD
jgi:hypothetical protein